MDWRFIRKSLVVSSVVALPVAAGLQVLFLGLQLLSALFPGPRSDLPGPIEWSWSWVLVLACILEAIFILVFLVPYTARAYQRHLQRSGGRLPRLPHPGLLFVGLWFGWMAILVIVALTTGLFRVVLSQVPSLNAGPDVTASSVALIVGLAALCLLLLYLAWKAQRGRGAGGDQL